MTEMQHIPEQSPFNYADLIDYREGQITSLALLRSKGVNITILAFDDEQLLPTHQTPGPALVQVVDGTAYFTIGNAGSRFVPGRSADDPAGVPTPSSRELLKMLVPPFCRWTERHSRPGGPRGNP